MSDVPATTDDVARRTGTWYDGHRADYAARTWDYARFPGLLDEIGEFERSLRVSGPVLDLGCGAGRDTEFLAHTGRPVVAADISSEMLQATIARCGRRTACVRLDMNRLPFRDKSFAGAWVCASLVHVPSTLLGGCLAELRRTMLSSARVAISMRRGTAEGWRRADTSPDHRWFTLIEARSFQTLLTAHGFVDVATTDSGRKGWYIATGTTP